MKEKLSTKLADTEIKQTKHKSVEASPAGSASPGSRVKIEPIRFKEDVINRIKKSDYVFGGQKYLYIPFKVSRDTHQKGLKLKIAKGRAGDKHTKKTFYIQFWFNNKPHRHLCGVFSQSFGVKECNDYLIELCKDHTDPKTGFWIKSPIETARDKRRIVPKKNTELPSGKTINEVLEAYCAGDPEINERGFLKVEKEGFMTSKSAKNMFRTLAGYNKRQSHVTFEDDENGWSVAKFLPNKRLRTTAPKSWQDLFRKFPPGHGIIKPREYYNRRTKQTYITGITKNKSIYDSDLGKSLISKLKPGDVEDFTKTLSSEGIKRDYVVAFKSLWICARKRGWLGTNPGSCPVSIRKVYVRKEIKKEDPYLDVSISVPELNIFFECSEKLSQQFPFKAELHQLMVVTGLRKAEALKLRKEHLDFDEGIIDIPRGINKGRKKDQVVPITPEVEIVLRNILDMGDRPGLEFYKMKDFPWLFATRKWSQNKMFNKDFRLSIKTRLGGDEKYIPALRQMMRDKLQDPELLYAPKVLRKTYVHLSKLANEGRSDKVKHLSRHKSEKVLEESYDKPTRAEIKDWGNKTTQILTFIRPRKTA